MLTHVVSHADGWWGPLPLVQKGHTVDTVDTVDVVDAVDTVKYW